LFASCIILASASQPAAALQNDASTTVFQLGRFDRSSSEFASGNPKEVVRFIATQSDPSKDWFSWQPAALESTAENTQQPAAAAPRTVEFSLAGAPEYHFHLSFAYRQTGSEPGAQEEMRLFRELHKQNSTPAK
jgi:hypothetical protein